MNISELGLNPDYTILITGGAGFIGSNITESLMETKLFVWIIFQLAELKTLMLS